MRPGTDDAVGDGIAVPDGVECPRPEGHAPGRTECPRRRRVPDGYGCSVWPGPDSGAQARVSRTPRRCCYFLRRSPRLEPEVVWSSWRRGWVEGRGLEGCRVVALIDSARVVAAGPGTLIPPLGAPIPEPAPFPASHPFWFSRRHPEVVVGRRRWWSWRTSGSGCHGGPTLRCRGRGHPARAGTFLCGRGQMTRWGTGLLSPTASNAPARKDTHPAAWNVPVGVGSLLSWLI